MERAAFRTLLAAIVVMPITKTLDLPLVAARLTGFEVFGGVMIVLWFLARRGTLGRETFILPGRAELGLALLLTATALSSINVWRLLGTPRAWNNFAIELLTFVFLAIFVFAARDLVAPGRRSRLALTAWFAGGVLVAVAGLVGWAEMIRCERPLSFLVIWDMRLLSTFTNPNQAAAYIVPTAALLAAVWATPTARLTWGPLALFCALIVVLMGTASKSGTMAALATAAVMLLWVRMNRRVVALMACSTILILAVAGTTSVLFASGNTCMTELGRTHQQLTFGLSEQLAVALSRPVPRWSRSVPHGKAGDGDGERGPHHRQPGGYVEPRADSQERVAQALAGGGSSSGHALGLRRALLGYAASMFAVYPVIGLGAGTMALHVLAATGGQYYYSTHNTVVTLAAEVGLFGAAGFCWFFGALGWALVRRARTANAADDRFLAIGMALAIFAVFVMGLTMDAQRQRVLWLAAALAAATLSRSAGERPGDSGSSDAGVSVRDTTGPEPSR